MNGKECLQKNREFCKYHSLMYFEQAKSYYDKYLEKIKMTTLDIKVKHCEGKGSVKNQISKTIYKKNNNVFSGSNNKVVHLPLFERE